jgi:hypothetical protein
MNDLFFNLAIYRSTISFVYTYIKATEKRKDHLEVLEDLDGLAGAIFEHAVRVRVERPAKVLARAEG